MGKISNKYWALSVCLALALVTLAVFWQVRHHEFIDFDDGLYIVDNAHVKAGLTREGLVWAFTKAHAHNWHPLTWLSHMLDCEFYGLDPGGHHFTSVLLHITNAILLFLVFNRMTANLWSSAFVATAFALHPLHVESVTWASERKDVLSTLFWMLTMWAYVRYAEQPRIRRYLLVVLAFCLGLMAKQMLVTLPLVLLLLDYWPLRRIKSKRQSFCNSSRLVPVSARQCTLEKLPLLILSVIAGVVVYLIQQRTEVMKPFIIYPLAYRVANALVAYMRYIGKMLWPSHLAIFYPHPRVDLPVWQIVMALLLLMCITAAVLRRARQNPYLAVGWLWYLITLVPVIGLVQVGLQALADRYTYMPLTGLFIIVAWGIPASFARLHYRKVLLSLSALVLLSALGVTAWRQVGHWRNNITLYKHAAAVVRDNWWAYHRLGRVLARQDNPDEAIKYFTEATRIDPNFAEAHVDFAAALIEQGKLDEAVTHLTEALRVGPDYAPAHINLGVALARQDKLDEAITHFNQALRINPEHSNVRNNLGLVFLNQGRLEEAVTLFTEALRIEPDYLDAINNLGVALERQGKYDLAIQNYKKTLQLKPDYHHAHRNIGLLMVKQGRYDEAIEHFNEALRAEPNWPEVYNHLGDVYTQQGRYDLATQSYKKTLQLKPDYHYAHYDIGLALVKQGRYDEAIEHFNDALRAEPNWPIVYYQLAAIYHKQGRLDLVVKHCTEALRLKPDFLEVRINLARALFKLGRIQPAIEQYYQVLQLEPNRIDVLSHLAWILATNGDTELRNPTDAVKFAGRVCELTEYSQPDFLDIFAAAYAAAGKFTEAVATAERALALAKASGQKKLTEQIQNRLRLYKSGRPYVEPSTRAPSD